MNILESLGQMTRFANRIRNTHPELVNTLVGSQIDEARKLLSQNSDIKDSEILSHQVATNLPASTSLEGCPFHYCDKNPVCETKCRYNKN